MKLLVLWMLASQASLAQTPGLMRFTRVSIYDPAINNLEAASLLVPAGWQSQGGVRWLNEYTVLANLLVRVTDPQTGATMETLPRQNFTWLPHPVMPIQLDSNYLGNIYHPPVTDIPQFVQLFFVPQGLGHLRGLSPVAAEPLAAVAQAIQANYGPGTQVNAMRVGYEYPYQGQPWQEIVYCTLTYEPNSMGCLWQVQSAYTMRAPKAVFARMLPLLLTCVHTLRIGPDWFAGYSYVQKLFEDRQAQGIRNAAALSATITANSAAIRQMYADSYRRQSESVDRINQNFSQYIRDVETYQDPYQNRPIQLPSGYQDAWVNARGEYVLTNGSFSPGQEWQHLQRTR